ncbi:uncharacterized protein TNCV_3640441 [Trichonephila clavipes]|nr:uncharacterized protein TNCV_3640441 [Trichonephila clavipes]
MDDSGSLDFGNLLVSRSMTQADLSLKLRDDEMFQIAYRFSYSVKVMQLKWLFGTGRFSCRSQLRLQNVNHETPVSVTAYCSGESCETIAVLCRSNESVKLRSLFIIVDLGRPCPGLVDMDLVCQVIYSQFGLAVHQNDHQARRRFVEWAQNEIAVVPDFHKRILFSDKAHFWLNGYVNKQNCRIWSEANPQVYVETPLHPEKLTVWCALWAGGIIGPCFFKNDEGHNVTVNGDRYRAMITNFFIPKLNNHDVQELRFQQDGATCHTARATIDLLKDTFGDRLI